jgi:hypothetical protein
VHGAVSAIAECRVPHPFGSLRSLRAGSFAFGAKGWELRTLSSICFGAMSNTPNLNRIGIRTNEE